jgi:hypothetical protein
VFSLSFGMQIGTVKTSGLLEALFAACLVSRRPRLHLESYRASYLMVQQNRTSAQKRQTSIGEWISSKIALADPDQGTQAGFEQSWPMCGAAETEGMPTVEEATRRSHRMSRVKVEALKLSVLSSAKIQKWKEAFLIRAGSTRCYLS